LNILKEFNILSKSGWNFNGSIICRDIANFPSKNQQNHDF
jgi:hypothetical protein